MIARLFEKIAGAINRHPVWIAGLVVLVFCISLYGMTQISMEVGSKTYQNQDDAKGILNADFAEKFQASSIILIIETEEPTRHDILLFTDRLERTIRQQENIQDVYGIADVVKEANNGNLPSTQAEIDSIVTATPAGVRDALLPSSIMAFVQIRLNGGLSDDVNKVTLHNIKSLVATSDPPPGTTISVTGTPAFIEEMNEAMTRDMGTLIGAAMALMILVMGILFAYVRYRFLPVVLVGIGLVSALGMMGLAGIKLNMAVIGAFPVLIGLGIDYAIQFHARFDEESRKGSLDDAVFMTVTRTGPAVLYAMLATSVGFLAMFISPVPMIRSFGIVAIIGIAACYLVSLIGLPTIAKLLKYTPKPEKPAACYAVGKEACNSMEHPGAVQDRSRTANAQSFSYGAFLTKVSMKIAKYPIPILLVVAVIAGIGFQVDPSIPVETNEKAFVPSDMQAKVQLDKVMRVLGSTNSASFYVRGQSVTDLDCIVWMKSFQDYELSHHSQLTRSTSIVTYILAYNNNVLPDNQDELDAVLDRIPAEIKGPYISGSMDAVIEFGMVKLTSEAEQDLKDQMIREIAFLEPPIGITVQPTGDFEVFTTLMHDLTSSKDAMTYLGFILILIYLVLVYRHFHAVSPLVPIVLIVGWNAVAMYILGIAYTPLTATLGSMTIGVASEYTILVMERYAEEEERLHNPMAAIQESVKKIGTAITVSGLATFFGFSALVLASFPVISNFGITTLIAVGFSLMGAIFIMPAVLSLVGQFTEWLGKRKASRQIAG